MPTVTLTDQNYERVIKESHIVFLQYWRSTCGWCVRFAPVYQASARNHPEIVHGMVETDTTPQLNGLNTEITGLPGIVAYREGLRVFMHSGFLAADKFEDIVQQVRWLDMDEVRREVARLTKSMQQPPTQQAPTQQAQWTTPQSAANGASRKRTAGAAVAGSSEYGWPGL